MPTEEPSVSVGASSGRARLHVLVHGFVQGVGFRYYTIEVASDLGLTGWVRNLKDGSVEAVAEGERAQLDRWLAALQLGRSGAQVTRVEAEWQAPSGEFRSFSLQHL
ncbi:MAG: acylphosphatase [Chloroflexota bacterium]